MTLIICNFPEEKMKKYVLGNKPINKSFIFCSTFWQVCVKRQSSIPVCFWNLWYCFRSYIQRKTANTTSFVTYWWSCHL